MAEEEDAMGTSLMQTLHNTLGADSSPFTDHEGKPLTLEVLRKMYSLYLQRVVQGELFDDERDE